MVPNRPTINNLVPSKVLVDFLEWLFICHWNGSRLHMSYTTPQAQAVPFSSIIWNTDGWDRGTTAHSRHMRHRIQVVQRTGKELHMHGQHNAHMVDIFDNNQKNKNKEPITKMWQIL